MDTISKAMSTRSEDTRREVGAVFQSSEAFADAVFGLEAAGFDRAELSALGAEEPLQACLKAAECAKERAADSAYSKHDAVVLDDDTQQQRVLFTSLTASCRPACLGSGPRGDGRNGRPRNRGRLRGWEWRWRGGAVPLGPS